MAETRNRTIIAIILVIIVVIILVALLIWVLMEQTNFVPLGGACVANNQCVEGLVCEEDKCRVPLGGSCSSVSDCVTQATDCLNGVCVVSSQPLPPTPCLVDLDCRSGERCAGSVTKVNGTDKFRFSGHQTVDVSSFGSSKATNGNTSSNIIFLMDDGTLRHPNGSMIRSDLKLTSIFEVGGQFFGINNGRIVRLIDTSPVWRWCEVDWSPKNVVYANVSLNQEFLWLQVPQPASPTSAVPNGGFKGFLFQFKVRKNNRAKSYRRRRNKKYDESDSSRCSSSSSDISCRRRRKRDPKLVRTEQLNQGVIRVYGTDEQTFIDINQTAQTGTLFRFGQISTVTDIVDGAIDQSGNVLKITSTTCQEIYSIIILPMNDIYQLDRRFCRGADTTISDGVIVVGVTDTGTNGTGTNVTSTGGSTTTTPDIVFVTDISTT